MTGSQPATKYRHQQLLQFSLAACLEEAMRSRLSGQISTYIHGRLSTEPISSPIRSAIHGTSTVRVGGSHLADLGKREERNEMEVECGPWRCHRVWEGGARGEGACTEHGRREVVFASYDKQANQGQELTLQAYSDCF